MPILARLIPFIMLGIALVAFALGLILLMYLFVFGALVGLALFAISWIRTKFFQPKEMTPYSKKSSEKRGHTIDHQD